MKKLRYLLPVLLSLLLTATAHGAFSDLPPSGWARDAVTAACGYGLMDGIDADLFGVGRTMSRAQFVTVLSRMLGWEAAAPDAFSDLSGHWAREAVNAAAAAGAVDSGGDFRPDEPITRREMAVMLVRALGYDHLAQNAYPLPFTDVSADRGYIAIAYDMGIINGNAPASFSPDSSATREQAAAMLVRVYDKLHSSTEWTHAFYAISSYSQIQLAKSFDAVSLGWSRMTWTADGGASLNTTAQGGNEFRIPEGYASAIQELQSAGVKLHLSVYMDTSSGLADLLSSPEGRAQAVEEIMAEVSRPYDGLNTNPFTGVTIDFEGLRSPQRDSFTQFLTALSAALRERNLTLYVAVMPATADGVYYDGYDCRAIGELADKVILMAHDYHAKNLSGFLRSTYYQNTALTPISSVYYSLRTALDPDKGVQDPDKLVLAVSCSSIAWETDEQGLLLSETPLYPTAETIRARMLGGAERGWSETYHNPYLRYATPEGQHVFLWYENGRSVGEKVSLARMFGVKNVSVWRLGLIPSYQDQGLDFDVMAALR